MNTPSIGDFALRRKESHSNDLWLLFVVNETYLSLMTDYPEDYRLIEKRGKSWLHNHVGCELSYITKLSLEASVQKGILDYDRSSGLFHIDQIPVDYLYIAAIEYGFPRQSKGAYFVKFGDIPQ